LDKIRRVIFYLNVNFLLLDDGGGGIFGKF